MVSEKDKLRIIHIFEAIELIEQFVLGVSRDIFVNSVPLQRQVYYEMAVIGEASNKVEKSTQEKYQEVSWRDAVDMRNVIIHEYFGVDAEKVWDTVQSDIPLLKSQIEKIIKEL